MIINNIRKLRKEKRITMVELSRKAGIAEPTVRLAELEILRVKMRNLRPGIFIKYLEGRSHYAK